jgi:hypothetical protein
VSINLKQSKSTTDGKAVVSTWPTEGSRSTIVTPNWCDPTTWYHKSVRAVAEVATDSGDHLTYTLANQNVIDVYHGKITGEDLLLDGSENSFLVAVTVNDVAKTEKDPHDDAGDFSVDYVAGSLTFGAALDPADVVKVTYHRSDGSCFVIKPKAGKKLKIKDVEVQFSTNIVLTDTVVFQPYGLVDVFAPQLIPSPYPSGTLIPIGNPTVYKTMMNYVDEANGAMPEVPAMGGDGWRGTSQPIQVFPWRYQAMTELVSSCGMEIRIQLQHETPFGGDVATATFYCLSEPEE